jgi:tetrahydromethanopterin S-methyltransferase subunit B
MNDHCIHEEAWGVVKTDIHNIKEDIHALDSDINGNGQPGLRDTVKELSVHVEDLKNIAVALNGNVTELLTFKTRTETRNTHVQRSIMIWITVIGLLFTGVNVAFGILSRMKRAEIGYGTAQPEYNNKPPILLRDGRVIDSISPEYYPEDIAQ